MRAKSVGDNHTPGTRRFVRGIGAGALVLGITVSAVSSASSQSATTLDDLFANPGITRGAHGEVVVDVAADQKAAIRALDAAGGALEGQVVRFEGVEVAPGSERRANDQYLSRFDDPTVGSRCLDLPTVARAATGKTTPYLRCEGIAGENVTGRAVSGTPTEGLEAALTDVLASFFGPDAEGIATVDVVDGVAAVDLDTKFADLVAALDPRVRGQLDNAMIFTAHSNGAISHIQISLDGDCFAYALLAGGDTCALVALDTIPAP